LFERAKKQGSKKAMEQESKNLTRRAPSIEKEPQEVRPII
jgi:hypothetical protein